MANYLVRTFDAPTGNTAEYLVFATSCDEAMTQVERRGFDYTDAEVCDEQGHQLAVYGDEQ